MTCILTRVGVSVNESDPLNIVTDMMIVFVSPHDEIFLSLFEAQVSDWLGALSANVDICKVFLRLTILALLVSETRERRALLNVDALHRLDTLDRALGDCAHTIKAVVYLRAIL
jgi:hypothetical protein